MEQISEKPPADTVLLSFEGRAPSCYDPHREIKNELYVPKY